MKDFDEFNDYFNTVKKFDSLPPSLTNEMMIINLLYLTAHSVFETTEQAKSYLKTTFDLAYSWNDDDMRLMSFIYFMMPFLDRDSFENSGWRLSQKSQEILNTLWKQPDETWANFKERVKTNPYALQLVMRAIYQELKSLMPLMLANIAEQKTEDTRLVAHLTQAKADFKELSLAFNEKYGNMGVSESVTDSSVNEDDKSDSDSVDGINFYPNI